VYLSAATLVVVPATLLSHWQAQVHSRRLSHCVSPSPSLPPSLALCASLAVSPTVSRTVCLPHRLSHCVSGPRVDKHVAGSRESSLLRVCVLDSTKTNRALSAQQLAWDFDLVLTTISRLSSEWTAAEKRGADASLLLQVHWLRVILDEGHMLGASLGITNRVSMACALAAERRWVMTVKLASLPLAHHSHSKSALNTFPWHDAARPEGLGERHDRLRGQR
jgi:SNF2 family DNA or RNA helicase